MTESFEQSDGQTWPELLREEDLIYLAQVLDVEAEAGFFVDGVTHDERWSICQDALNAREAMRTSMGAVAEQMGIDVEEAVIADWQPNDVELGALSAQLVESRQRLAMIQGLSEYVEDLSELAEQSGVPLRKYQREPVEATLEWLLHAPRNEHGGKSGIIEMPTGGGKTAIFSSITAQLKYGEKADEPIRTLVLVPTQTILKQTIGEDGKQGFGKFAPHLDVGAYYQYSKQLDVEVVVMTTAAFNQLMAQNKMPYFPTVIVDEPHTVLGKVTAENVKEYIKDKYAIGLDATPEYNPEHSAYEIFDHEIYRASFKDMVHAGRLAPMRGYLLDAEPSIHPDDLPEDPKERRAVIRAARLEARMQIAEGLVKEAVEMGQGVLVRCPAGEDIEIAVRFAERLREQLVKTTEADSYRWIEAWPAGGSTQRQTFEEREKLFDYFRDGDVDVITYVKAIGMGWDGPRAKRFIDLAGTTSPIEMRQNVGRVTRLIIDEHGKPVVADVYSFRDPSLGKRQYTCLDALESKSGQALRHEESEEAPIPVSRRFRRAKAPELLAVNEEVIGETILVHEVDVVLPDSTEISATVRQIKSEAVDLEEACSILCLDLPVLRRLLKSVGSNPKRKIPKSELMDLIQMIPEIVPPTVPAGGFVRLSDIASRIDDVGRSSRMLSTLSFGRKRGIEPWRFNDPDQGIGFYYSEEDAERIVELLNESRK